MVSAKYIKQTVTKNNSVTAKEFYFESDLLDGKEHKVVPTDGNGATASVMIELKNHADELRYSKVDIDYGVTVTEQDGAKSQDVTISPETGKIQAGNPNDAIVNISGMKAGKIYTVTAATSNTYRKTLTGIIKVAQPDTNVYASVSDKEQYIEVTVWTTDYAGEVKLIYHNGLIPDNTDAMMGDAKATDGTITVNSWKTNTSHEFRFFKSDASKKYQVTVNDKEVTVQ